MLKCKFWNPSKIFPNIKKFQGYTLVIDGLHILGVPMGSQDFAMHFWDEILFQDVTHINDPPFLRNAQVVLSILFSCVTRQPFYFT